MKTITKFVQFILMTYTMHNHKPDWSYCLPGSKTTKLYGSRYVWYIYQKHKWHNCYFECSVHVLNMMAWLIYLKEVH